MAYYTSNKGWLRYWNRGFGDGTGPVGGTATRIRICMMPANLHLRDEDDCILPMRPLFIVVGTAKTGYTSRYPRPRKKRPGNFGTWSGRRF